MRILNSPNFVKEHDKIKKFIDSTSNENLKKQMKDLLNELIFKVKKLDQLHGDIVNIGKLSDKSQELRSNILEIRKKINKKLSESTNL